ncbi:MAG TPA: DUF4282 domain-containing protein, partial [Polyangiaceae bacterium LLY-WYZ-15_(1-7)]|nr:DUF4282 domain-containing protein [Polyangiaceae bacterium LLY-WYZ-15_(1-7)]
GGGGPGGGGPGGGGPGGGSPFGQGGFDAKAAQDKAKTFFRAFTDFKFENYLLPRVVKVLYGLFILAAIGQTLLMLYGGFDRAFLAYYTDVGEGLLVMLLAPIGGLLVLIAGRLYCEMLMIAYQLLQNMKELNQKTPPPE